MKLELSIKRICSITDATFIDNNSSSDFLIQNIIIDSRSPSITENTLFIALDGSKDHGDNYIEEFKSKGGRYVLTESQKDDSFIGQFIVTNSVKALQNIAEFHRLRFNIPVVAITGSNGKTIVKEWLYYLLNSSFSVCRSPKSFNSQIGVPLSLLEIEEENDIVLIEAGISRPNEMENLEKIIKPTLGIFTGIGDAHSANFDSREQKKEEKFKLFKNVEHLINAEELKPIMSIPFTDKASQINAATAVECAVHLGVNKESIEAKLEKLPIISMRLEQIEGINNNLLLNDAYNSDFNSLTIGIQHLNSIADKRKRVLVLTEFDEVKKDDNQLGQILSSKNIDQVLFVGDKNYLSTSVEADVFPDVNSLLKNLPSISDSVILVKGARNKSLEKFVHKFSLKSHITQLSVNLSHLRSNLEYFRSQLGNETMVLAMVKAQSYGTGLKEIANFLKHQKVDYFGVAYADEGVILRQIGIKQPIIVMNPESLAFDLMLEHELEPSIYSSELLNSFIHHLILTQSKSYPIHIKLDTGMNRLGFDEGDLDELINTIRTQPEIKINSVFSHLSVADDDNENEFTYGQIRKFEMMSGRIKDKLSYPFIRHLANSSGTINYARAHFDMVRLGIGLFGLLDRSNDSLKNVLEFSSKISQIKWIDEGESVGYGRAFIATKRTKIGIVPVGYADGLSRSLSQEKWSLLIDGVKTPIIGNICMDMCMVDLTNSNATTGSSVEIFGNENSIFEMADATYTIPYEIISGISSRVHRVYMEE